MSPWGTAAEPATTKTVPLENFESYTNDQQRAKIWYRPPHGGGTTQTIETVATGGTDWVLALGG